MQSTESEIWKDVVGYEGYYKVSNMGKVKAARRSIKCHNQFAEYYREYPEHEVYAGKLQTGYLQVCLSKHGKYKCYLVHRLVAEAFIPNMYNLPEVNHKDRDKTNNRVSNLEWCTKLENMHHAIENGWNPRLSRLGHKNSLEHNRSISTAVRGRYVTDDEIEYLRKSHKKQSKPCYCITTDQKFISYADAGRSLGMDPGVISYAIRRNQPTKSGYRFINIDKEDVTTC